MKRLSTLQELDISRTRLTPSGIKKIAAALKNNIVLTSLNLSGNYFMASDLLTLQDILESSGAAIAKMLEGNTVLKVLKLPFLNSKDLGRVVHSLRRLTSLETLWFGRTSESLLLV